jgi:hypothetical protein
MNNFYDIITAISETIFRNIDFPKITNQIFNAVMTGNANIYTTEKTNTTNLLSYEEMRIYGGGCVNCPTKMPTNQTYPHISAEDERNVWLIILGAFLFMPCVACLIISCRVCYFICKEKVCKCGVGENNQNYVVAHNV